MIGAAALERSHQRIDSYFCMILREIATDELRKVISANGL
jgi:hypothetical protein